MIVASQAGAPASLKLVSSRSGWMAAKSIPCRGERRSQLGLTDGVRAGIGTVVAETQHIQGSVVLGHRRQARHVSWPLVPSKVWNSPQSSTVANRRPSRSRWSASAAANSARSPARRPSPARSPVPSRPRRRPAPTIPARPREERSRRPAARIEHRSGESALGGQPHTAGCGRPVSHGAGPSRYDASQGSPVSDWSAALLNGSSERVPDRSDTFVSSPSWSCHHIVAR